MNPIALAALAFVTFSLGLGELMIAGILPAIATDTRVTIPVAGQLVTAYASAFALLSAPLAIGLRTMPSKRVLVVSLVVVAASNAGAALTAGFALLVMTRVLAAGGSAIATPLALAAVDRFASDEFRGRAHGIVFTGFSLAAMLGVPLGALIAAHYGWHATFGCVATLSACAAVIAARIAPRGNAPQSIDGPLLAATVARPRLRRTLAVSAVFLTAQYSAFTYFRPYFEQAGSGGITTIVMLFFLYGVFGIAGTLTGGAIVDRWGARRTMLWAVGGCALVLIALPALSHSVAGTSVAVAAWALTSWGFSPAVNRALTLAAGDAPDLALALNLTAFNVGIALGSAAGGIAIAFAGLQNLPFCAAALVIAAWLLALRTGP